MILRNLTAAVVMIASLTTVALAADAKEDVPCEAMGSIGVATMTPDGVITLRLSSRSAGMIAEGLLSYPPDHPKYDEVRQHLGGMRPGESKPVPPWC
jgi:hypothetical protein